MATTLTKAPSTPRQQLTIPPAPTPPTGKWEHPMMQEIQRRQEASIFTTKDRWNAGVFGAVLAASFWYPGTLLRYLLSLAPLPPVYQALVFWTFRLVLLYALGTSLRPYWARKDDMTDIPLTPTQRKLLGLSTASAPATPGSAYSTPPRYARTTPRSGSSRAAVIGSSPLDRSGSGSPIAGSPLAGRGVGSPYGFSGFGTSPVGSPLVRKAMEGRRWSSGASGLRDTINKNESLFSDSTGTPSLPSSPTPGNGSRNPTVALNSKWLYQRGKSRLSGGVYS